MEGKVIQYGICSAESVSELSGYVNQQLLLGYQLHGFIFTSTHHNIFFFHQAMTLSGVIKPVNKTNKFSTHSKK